MSDDPTPLERDASRAAAAIEEALADVDFEVSSSHVKANNIAKVTFVVAEIRYDERVAAEDPDDVEWEGMFEVGEGNAP